LNPIIFLDKEQTKKRNFNKYFVLSENPAETLLWLFFILIYFIRLLLHFLRHFSALVMIKRWCFFDFATRLICVIVLFNICGSIIGAVTINSVCFHRLCWLLLYSLLLLLRLLLFIYIDWFVMIFILFLYDLRCIFFWVFFSLKLIFFFILLIVFIIITVITFFVIITFIVCFVLSVLVGDEGFLGFKREKKKQNYLKISK